MNNPPDHHVYSGKGPPLPVMAGKNSYDSMKRVDKLHQHGYNEWIPNKYSTIFIEIWIYLVFDDTTHPRICRMNMIPEMLMFNRKVS